VSDHRSERFDPHLGAPLRRHTDTDPENVEWWTNLPDLVARLEKALLDAKASIKELRQGRTENRERIDQSRRFLVWMLVGAVAFNVATMLLFGYLFDRRDEQRERDIKLVRQEFYAHCSEIRDNAQTINRFLAAQAETIRTSPVQRTPAEKARIINGYNQLRQNVPVCHRPPGDALNPQEIR
jgi:hypothetical protein